LPQSLHFAFSPENPSAQAKISRYRIGRATGALTPLYTQEEIRPMPSARELVESCDTLVSLPEIYLRVRNVVDDPHSSMVDLAKALSFDPSMTARVLQTVNSPFYGVPRKIDTLSQAVNLLGMPPVQNIVFATSVAKAFTKLPPTVMNMSEYWRKSVLCALLSVQLARAAHLTESERLFIAGLLRDVGHLVLYQTVPDRAQSALVEATNFNQPLAEVERANIGCDYAEVGGDLINSWGMPVQLEEAVRHQLTPNLAPQASREAAVLHASGMLADYLDAHGTDAMVPSHICQAALHSLDLPEIVLEEVLPEAIGQLKDTLALIYPVGAARAA
jgi:HD-like signal output (HDOD) protein